MNSILIFNGIALCFLDASVGTLIWHSGFCAQVRQNGHLCSYSGRRLVSCSLHFQTPQAHSTQRMEKEILLLCGGNTLLTRTFYSSSTPEMQAFQNYLNPSFWKGFPLLLTLIRRTFKDLVQKKDRRYSLAMKSYSSALLLALVSSSDCHWTKIWNLGHRTPTTQSILKVCHNSLLESRGSGVVKTDA